MQIIEEAPITGWTRTPLVPVLWSPRRRQRWREKNAKRQMSKQLETIPF